MPLPKELTTVTKTSRYLALSLFIILPILAFFIGMNYQQMIDMNNKQSAPSVIIKKSVASIPITDQTTNWPTYSDAAAGFSMKYPQGWLATKKGPRSSPDIGYYFFTSPDFKSQYSQGGGPLSTFKSGSELLLLVQRDNNYFKTYDNYIKSVKQELQFSNLVQSEMTIDTYRIAMFSKHFQGNGNYVEAYTLVNNKTYVFTYETDQQSQVQTLEQILSTFSFIN